MSGDWSIDLTDFTSLQGILDRLLRETQTTPDLGDPMVAYRYLNARRQAMKDAYKQRPLLRIWDKHHRYIADLAGEKSVVVEEVMADSGTATVVIKHSNWLSKFLLYDRRAEEDIQFTLDPNPTNRSWQNRWGGKIVNVNAVRDKDGLHTVELEMVHNREHAKHILGGANPLLPPEIQFPKMFFLPWNMRTAGSIIMFLNLARQFFPLLSIPTNIFNPGAWLGVRDVIGGLNPLAWPIQVQFVNPLFDQSRTTILSSRWQDLHTVLAAPMQDAGCMLRAYTWLTEDDTSPHPELEALGDALARPTRNCVVFAFEDKSGVTGPTGTLIDGPLRLIAETADDLITNAIVPPDMYDEDGDGKTDPLIRKWLGFAPAKPKVVFREGEYTGIIDAKRSMKGSTAKTVMTGSRSPAWLNQLQTFGIKYGLSQLSAVVSYVIGAYQQPGTPGLEELYQGQLDNTLFAWQRFTDPRRVLLMGDLGFLEHFEQGQGTAYTSAGILDLRNGHWKTRAFVSFKTSIRNGMPWIADEHFTLGDRVAFQLGSVLHVDQVSAIRRSYDADSPLLVELSLGQDLDEEDPVAKSMRTLAGFWNLAGTFFGSDSMF
ncbi:hypothetical protein [Mycobacteroides abscessus]|uniref:Bacteriophage protein n=1 Tax=Mycobacteroides abscessus subsp. abscessus TaxID=1185650 RepID=A0AB74FE74_9MYCO|nr:hypothetical protein [Mycobacteroides abscessus]OHU67392.1 hypothetical protein BKG87_22110 [Mycobacteroides chelonae]QPO17479.1 minor tail protein [Mycobacterium phage phiGD23-1]QPO17599.1 minor tail protein [Mycobacterium phage phiGD22-1]QPO17782.1 minor tail protein [Mycobacterium phage phiGD20-1]QSM01763.1 minor tail protein [Mycobacterium phage prophiGD11-1]QSM02147.1 minor tail protein [Mycobacterium phage prophiGD20-1]QSM02618.1 minor tail protein [Mycobacterium phage prophiGD57-2]